MAIIFSASTGAGSSQKTSRFIGPILRWFNPETSEETVEAIQFGIRKTAHMGEYALLAALLWRARRKPTLIGGKWIRSDAIFAIGIAALYAMTDELHQSFVPSRQGSPWDVLLDTLGATLGILAIWAFWRWRKRE